MSREPILPILYDLAVTIGSETSLKKLLPKTLQRLLYYTSFPAGFITLDTYEKAPEGSNFEEEIDVHIEAAVGDFELVKKVGKSLRLPTALMRGDSVCETDKINLLKCFGSDYRQYKSYLRLPVENWGVIILLAPEVPETHQPITQMFKPVLAHLAKAILLCQRNDLYTLGLQEERNLYKEIFESSSSGVMITDPEGKIIKVNPAFTKITGYNSSEVMRKKTTILSSGMQNKTFYKEMWDNIIKNGYWQGEIINRRKNGETYPEWLNITSVYNRSGEIQNYVGIFSDISEKKKAEEQIYQLAFYDSLTLLPNRRLLMIELPQIFAASKRSSMYGAVMFLDIDNFKKLNDSKGHDIGDLLLIEISSRLKKCIRETDRAVRLGGDEFIVILESLSKNSEEAASLAEKIGEKILYELSLPYNLKEHTYYGTLSIGIVIFYGDSESHDDLFKHADTAMYQAKISGKNTIRFYDPEMQAAIEERIELEDELRAAVKNNQFLLHYQMQVNGPGNPAGSEVLIRWNHPQKGLLSPEIFISLAEETGMIEQIGLWVLKNVANQLNIWKNDPVFSNLVLAVNISARQFRHENFTDQVKNIINESGANPKMLKIELTESTILENIDDAAHKMKVLKNFGISFAMDDFGTGYSSLQYLKRLPLDEIKIDKSFIKDIHTDANDAAIVKAIIAISEVLGMNVIAEGVETKEQLEFLKSNGCFCYQGYYFSRPQPLEEFMDLLKSSIY